MLSGILLLTMGGIIAKALSLLIYERCRQTTLKFLQWGERKGRESTNMS